MEIKTEITQNCFTVSRKKSAKIVLMLPFLSAGPIILLACLFARHLTGESLFIYGIYLAAINMIAGPIYGIQLALWEVQVDGGEIIYKSLLKKRKLTFNEIKNVSKEGNGIAIYSVDCKKLFSIGADDDGYDLFYELVKERVTTP